MYFLICLYMYIISYCLWQLFMNLIFHLTLYVTPMIYMYIMSYYFSFICRLLVICRTYLIQRFPLNQGMCILLSTNVWYVVVCVFFVIQICLYCVPPFRCCYLCTLYFSGHDSLNRQFNELRNVVLVLKQWKIKALYGKQVPSSIHFYAKIKEKWHNVRSTVFNLWLKAMCKWAILTYYSVHLN